jgi:hypothetical protein
VEAASEASLSGEQDLVDARLQAEKDLDQPNQAEEGNHEGAYP